MNRLAVLTDTIRSSLGGMGERLMLYFHQTPRRLFYAKSMWTSGEERRLFKLPMPTTLVPRRQGLRERRFWRVRKAEVSALAAGHQPMRDDPPGVTSRCSREEQRAGRETQQWKLS